MGSKLVSTFLVLLAVILVLVLPVSPARAGGIVTVCDEAHLLEALAGGGTVAFTCSGTITLTNTITIAADTTIDGSGQSVTISGNHAVQVFVVNPGIIFSLNEVTIANGSASGNDQVGGGIHNIVGTVFVSNSTFDGNSASDTMYGVGGAIYNQAGTLTVVNSTFSNNTGWHSAAISNSGILIVNMSIFSNNSSSNDYGYGGAISNSGTFTVTNTTFSGNRAANGGSIDNFNGNLIIYNSTFYDNSATNNGGCINNYNSSLTISNSTFSGNSAPNGGGCIFHHGGFYGLPITVTNSTFFGNNGGEYGGGSIQSISGFVGLGNTIITSSYKNCSADFLDRGGNITYPDTTCPGIHSDPLLGPLQHNGGSTFTMALGESSPAIDMGIPTLCPAYDQRGVIRQIDGDGNGEPVCDTGAFEYQPRSVTTIMVDDPDPSRAGEAFDVTFTVTSTVGIPTGVVTVTVTNSAESCNATLNDGISSCELTLNTPGEYTLIASYNNTSSFLSSSDSEAHTVIPTTRRTFLPMLVK